MDCISPSWTATWRVLAEPEQDPDGTGVCEKNKSFGGTHIGLKPQVHHLLALRTWASYLSSLSCSFLAVLGETKALMGITWDYELKYLKPTGCSYLVSWFLLHVHVLMRLHYCQKPSILEKDVLCCWWECNLVQPLWKAFRQLALKIINVHTLWPSNATSGNGLTVMLAYFQNDVCVREFTAVLFAMEKTGNKSNAPYWRSG